MKKIISILFILGILVQVGIPRAEADVLDETVTPFLNALQAGNVDNIIAVYTGGKLQQNIRAAFARDNNYGAFLSKRYNRVIFTPTIVRQDEHQVIVQVDVTYPGNQTSTFALLVQEEADGNWHIVDQYSILKK